MLCRTPFFFSSLTFSATITNFVPSRRRRDPDAAGQFVTPLFTICNNKLTISFQNSLIKKILRLQAKDFFGLLFFFTVELKLSFFRFYLIGFEHISLFNLYFSFKTNTTFCALCNFLYRRSSCLKFGNNTFAHF